ncbi:MraY family glycosyltransferase [Kiloniella majae]|uniref:MraY family glycosyltransferase n=1 Tax=Kiloniella majae TaxID=1938558 RepID=UPI0015C506CA|nr:glycosyltransferase family 4 protein [Kiloniella majae]
MTELLHVLTIFAISLLASCVATAMLRKVLINKSILDNPNERSSHTIPTPRGGGLALMGIILLGWAGHGSASLAPLPGFWFIFIGSIVLMAISWLDDLKNLSPKFRLLIQIIVVVISLWGINHDGQEIKLFPVIVPQWVDYIFIGLSWVWFINLYNFMDGIDGITGVETSTITFGLVLIASYFSWQPDAFYLPLFVLAATLGFLIWNWEPAAIFLGDVGSIPLGYILGWFMIFLIIKGMWAAAFILPLYYLCDATITLLKRAVRKQKIWEAHKEHCYQIGVQNGLSHKAVSLTILACNIVLIALALFLSTDYPWYSLLIALIIVFSTMKLLKKKQSQ